MRANVILITDNRGAVKKKRTRHRTRGWRRLRRILLLTVLSWFGATIGSVIVLRWLNPPTTAIMLADRLGAWLDAEPNYRFQHRWDAWPQISGSAKLAVIASEDQRFADHFGFDFVEIGNALDERDRGKSHRGASTITQQTAKNLFLWSGQSWIRKGLEAYFTLLIETCWPKTRILEVYLNVAEFGPGVFGVGAASDRYFRLAPARLNRAQSALLAAVLPNPRLFRVASPSSYVRERQSWILQQMSMLGGESYLWRLD
jgi:monofunctional biosynthetic peptidoglycan transglycosylase